MKPKDNYEIHSLVKNWTPKKVQIQITREELAKWILRHVCPQGTEFDLFDDLKTHWRLWKYLPQKANMLGNVTYHFNVQPNQTQVDGWVDDQNSDVAWESYSKVYFDSNPLDAIQKIEFQSISGNSEYSITRVDQYWFEVTIQRISFESIIEFASFRNITSFDLVALLLNMLAIAEED